MFNPEMFDRSKRLYDALRDRYPFNSELLHLIACTQLSKEVYEVLDCVAWKMERGMESASRAELLEELVDVFKYFNRLLCIHDITPEEFQKAYDLKSEIVERRLLCRSLVKPK